MALTLLARLPLAPAPAAAGASRSPPRRSSSACWASFGGSLTMASIAVLPILIGLAVDYAIQFQARFDEAVASGRGAPRRRAPRRSQRRPDDRHRLPGHRRRLPRPPALPDADGPQLRLAPPRRHRDRLRLALTAGFAALSACGARGARQCPSAGPGGGPRGAAPARRISPATGRRSLEHPLAASASGLALSIRARAGGRPRPGRDRLGRSAPRSKPSPTSAQLAPQNLRAVEDLNELQDATGVSGELDVSVEAPDLTDPATIEWMAAFKQRVLRANGFSGENPSCLEAEVCPGPALSDFLARGGGKLTPAGIEATLAALLPLRPAPGRAARSRRPARSGHRR